MRFIDPDGMWPDDPPGFKKGWNQTVQRYNDNLYSGLQDRIDNPKLLLNDLANAANGLMNLAADVTGISNFVTGENKTAQALTGVISTVAELPKMSAEEIGVVAAGFGIAITEIALTRKSPLGEIKSLTKGGVVNSKVLGNAMEQALDMTGPKKAINVGGRTRFPDRLTTTLLEESKNVKHLYLSGQIRDYLKYSQDNNLQMKLHTRPSTTFSKPLKELLDNNTIIHNKVSGF